MNSSSTKITYSMCREAVSRVIGELETEAKISRFAERKLDIFLKIEEIIDWAASPPGKEVFDEVAKLSVDQRMYAKLLSKIVDLNAELAKFKTKYKDSKNGENS